MRSLEMFGSVLFNGFIPFFSALHHIFEKSAISLIVDTLKAMYLFSCWFLIFYCLWFSSILYDVPRFGFLFLFPQE